MADHLRPHLTPMLDFSDPGLDLLLPLDGAEASPSNMAGDDDFDYGAFLCEQQQHDLDIDYLAEESSASTSTNTISIPDQAIAPQPQPRPQQRHQTGGFVPLKPAPPPAGPTSAARPGNAMLLARQRLERRGHTKSRRGCFNCKRRRIKCQETRPACGHCVKTGLNCEYPAVPLVVHQPQHQIPVFSMQDMRFFQHFLLQCYPHHPIGSESIWTHEIPCLSQKYDYLMHAILGLAASELLCEDASLAEAAMTHRLKAIRAIKKAIAETAASAPPCPTKKDKSGKGATTPPNNTHTTASDGSFEEGNALMATCYALTFQSVLLDDGMAEYMTFIRGIILVGIQMYVRRARLIFGDLMGEQAEESKLAPHMAGVPLIERAWVDGAVAAIAALEPLAARHPVERRYHEMIENMARQLYVSSWGAYKALTQHYAWWMMLPHEQFQRLVDPANQPAVLLAAHWIALKQIMEPVTDAQKRAWADGGGGTSDSLGMIRWLKYLNRLVGAEYRAYNDWPVWVEQQLAGDRGFFGRAD